MELGELADGAGKTTNSHHPAARAVVLDGMTGDVARLSKGTGSAPKSFCIFFDLSEQF
jgi:hypothetical protein